MERLVVTAIVLAAGCGGGVRHPEHPARTGVWNECETHRESICGTFAWDEAAQRFDARWDNGAEGHVTVRISGNDIEMDRVDTGGPYPGTRASYRGVRTATGFSGDVTWTVPNGTVIQGRWEAAGDPPAVPNTAGAAGGGGAPAVAAELPSRAGGVTTTATASSTEASTAPPATNPPPSPSAPTSPACVLEAFLTFAGPDRHFQCGALYTIEEAQRGSCSATAMMYMGPAASFRVLIQAGPSAPPREADDDAEVAVLTRQGAAFRLNENACADLTEQQFESAIAEQESIPTADPE